MTGPEIQAASGVRRGAIGAYKSGACHPSFQKGEALIAVWCRRTGKSRDDVPRVPAETISAAKIAREDRGPTDAFASRATAAAVRDVSNVTRAWLRASVPA